jgi:hypothetical protein
MSSPRIRRVILRLLALGLVGGLVFGLAPPVVGRRAPSTVIRTVGLDAERLLPRTAAAARTPDGGIRLARAAWTPATAVCAPIRFTMVGFVWEQEGGGEIRARVAWGSPGEFGDAVLMEADPSEGPDPGSAEHAGLEGTPPLWTGEAHCARLRLRLPAGEALTDPRAVFLNTSGTAEPPSLLDRAGDLLARAWGMAAPDVARAASPPPGIIPRSGWGAKEKLRRCGPDYAEDGLKMAYVHHTVNSNAYSKSRADDLIRGIYAYHVRGRHFCDIAYNFLIDRFGRIYEGRYGGMEEPVVGAHAMGFNTGSTGVAALGNFTSRPAPRAMIRAYKRLLAWRLDVAHLRPTGKAVMESAGGHAQKFKKGQEVTLPVIAGHRDTGYTTCPGGMLYKKLVPIRRDVEARGLPKIWTVTSSVDAISLVAAQTVHYHAFLSQAMPWSVDITDAAGTLVRRFTGGDGAIEATWNGRMADGVTPVPPGTYTATMRAQAGDRIAREAVLTTIVNP